MKAPNEPICCAPTTYDCLSYVLWSEWILHISLLSKALPDLLYIHNHGLFDEKSGLNWQDNREPKRGCKKRERGMGCQLCACVHPGGAHWGLSLWYGDVETFCNQANRIEETYSAGSNRMVTWTVRLQLVYICVGDYSAKLSCSCLTALWPHRTSWWDMQKQKSLITLCMKKEACSIF